MKAIKMLMMVVCLVMVGVVFAATFQETYDAASAKFKAGQWAEARTGFQAALALVDANSANAGLCHGDIAESYYIEKNYPAAKAENSLVLQTVNAWANHKAGAQMRLGDIAYDTGDIPLAITEYTKLLLSDAIAYYKETVLKQIFDSTIKPSDVIAKMTATEGKAWDGYLWLARIQDKAGLTLDAISTLDDGIGLLKVPPEGETEAEASVRRTRLKQLIETRSGIACAYSEELCGRYKVSP